MSAAVSSISGIPLATAMTAAASTLLNLVCWLIGEALGGMRLGAAEVVVASAIGALLGGVAFAVLRRFTRTPSRAFTKLTVVVLALYALGPVSAMLAPYREGAPLFNLSTVVATELMHLVSGGCAVYFFCRTVPAASPGAQS